MLSSKLRRRIGRIGVTTTAVVTTTVLAATAAHAAALSDTASWGWTSVTDIEFTGSTNNWVYFSPAVNDNVQDGWSVTVVIRAHDYDGTTRADSGTVYTDHTHDGNARYFGKAALSATPYQIYALSIQLCKTKSNGSRSCKDRKYTYR